MKSFVILSFFLFTIIYGQLVEELDNLNKFKDRFIFEPNYIYKVDGLWFDENTDELFTGRFKIFSKEKEITKIAECTIVDGVKNGLLMQYYNAKEELPGIMGVYIRGIRTGPWEWIFPDDTHYNHPWIDSDFQIIINIEYQDGIRHGSMLVDKANLESGGKIKDYTYPRNDVLVRGKYINGQKTGEWYFNEYIYSDFDVLTEPMNMQKELFFWSKKEVYKDGKVLYSKCQEPWDKEIDCDNKSESISRNQFILFPENKIKMDKIKENAKNLFFVKDDNNIDVEINMNTFLNHIKRNHNNGVSVHKEKGSLFTVDDDFRKNLNKQIMNK